MSDIRNYFKKTSIINKKRTREQTDTEEKEETVSVPKPAKQSPTKKPIEKTASTRRDDAYASPQKKVKTNEIDPIEKTVPTRKDDASTSSQKKTKTKEIDPIEKKKRSESYKSYVNRGGPDAPGSKTIPEGEDNCLQSLTFVISGVLESLERDECKKLIEKYGGRVTLTISGKTNYLLIGRDCSEAKTNKAKQLKVEILSEDDLLQMIATRSGDRASTKKQLSSKSDSSPTKPKRTSSSVTSKTTTADPVSVTTTKTSVDQSGLLWVDKYKPETIKSLIGQQGEKSCVQKLLIWLRDWYQHHGQSNEKVKAKPPFGYNRNENPAMFKAALLSGPPGIGKTTAAQLACKHLNYEYVEKNASDQRSKKSMANLSSDTYSIASISDPSSSMSKYVLIMDEVDGVAGNEDRGGVQELIALIKRSRVPIICICNDRQHSKIRSLANYCYDLRFPRPNLQQIRAAMLTILHQENTANIKQEVLDEMIQSCNQDIRQTIHSLNLWSIQGHQANSTAAKMIDKSKNISPFELCRLSFSDEFRHKSVIDKSDIFFSDYRMMPLFIQENYLQCQPHPSKSKLTDVEHLKLISNAADNIALGDVCSQMIFSRNESWSLLPYQAIFSTVAPCSYVRGHLRGMVSFSSYFGQRSRANKNERLLNEIEKHMCLKIASANKQQFNLDYLPYLSRSLLASLKHSSQEQGIEQCISFLDEYHLNRDDFQTLIELNTWGKGSRNLYEQLDTQMKSSFTRNYNKTNHRMPYAMIDIKKLKKSKALSDEEAENEEEEEEVPMNESSINDDAMIKQAQQRLIKPPAKKARKK